MLGRGHLRLLVELRERPQLYAEYRGGSHDRGGHKPPEGKGALGKSVEFDAKTTEMDPERGTGWNTVEGEVMTSGEARFEEVLPDCTRVEVTTNYSDPPGRR